MQKEQTGTQTPATPTALLLILANVLDLRHHNGTWVKRLRETPMTDDQVQGLQNVVLAAVASGMDSGLAHLKEENSLKK